MKRRTFLKTASGAALSMGPTSSWS
ncbi:MAG: twin-arginine translocation signal domain-containing protein [Phycisphaerae bacterium]|nr:twin-arginine translocation signal domain-containing protein [Phycisphaerae bacterium]